MVILFCHKHHNHEQKYTFYRTAGQRQQDRNGLSEDDDAEVTARNILAVQGVTPASARGIVQAYIAKAKKGVAEAKKAKPTIDATEDMAGYAAEMATIADNIAMAEARVAYWEDVLAKVSNRKPTAEEQQKADNAQARREAKAENAESAEEEEPKAIGTNKFQYFTGTLSELISQAKQSAQGLIKKIIAPVSSRLKNDLLKNGIDIDDEYNHVIDNSAIRHTLNNHGNKNEEKRGQTPITEEDFERISDIVENYDNIEIETGRRGEIKIRYSKTYSDGTTIYVEEQRVNRKELAAVTMWKMKNPTLTDANRTETTQISDLNEVSTDKNTTNSETANEIGEKSAVSSAQQITEVDNMPSAEEQERSVEHEGEWFTMEPAQYTTKRGKVLDMVLVKFTFDMSENERRVASMYARQSKGWYDRERGGYMMRSEEDAHKLGETIGDRHYNPITADDIRQASDVTYSEPQKPVETEGKEPTGPVWQYEVSVDRETGITRLSRTDVSGVYPIGDARWGTTTNSPEEMLEILKKPANGMGEVLEAVGTTLHNKIKTREFDRKAKEMLNRLEDEHHGYNVGDKVLYYGKEATIVGFERDNRPLLDTGYGGLMYEIANWSDIENPQQNQPASSPKGQDLTTGSTVDNVADDGAKIVISKYGAKHELNKLIHKYVGVNIVLNIFFTQHISQSINTLLK